MLTTIKKDMTSLLTELTKILEVHGAITKVTLTYEGASKSFITSLIK